MTHPEFTCSHCGSGELRRSRSTSLGDLPRIAFGKYPFRCLDCKERVWVDLYRRGKDARCPRCLTPDVIPAPNTRTYNGFLQRWLLRFGAHAYRCSFCNHKFVSFKKKNVQQNPEPKRIAIQPEPAPQMASAAAGRK